MFVAQALPQTISVATSFSVAGLPYDSIQVNVVLPALALASALDARRRGQLVSILSKIVSVLAKQFWT